MNPLSEQIRDEIARVGPISFARFMDLALYLPGLGYYERLIDPIGKRGDFYTSISVGSLFGELLAFQFAEWAASIWSRESQQSSMTDSAGASVSSDRDSGFERGDGYQWVEAGAHTGQLALDVLCWTRKFRPGLFDQLEYWIIEPSAWRLALQETRLAEFRGKVRWFPDWDTLPRRIAGVIFANELLDAFPVHRFGWNAGAKSWFEWGVYWRDQRFIWVRLPECAGNSPEMDQPLAEILPHGYVVETSPGAEMWWREAVRALEVGRLATFDYGFTAEELMRPERANGTLRGYRGHRVASDVLESPGELDLTAHVNFEAIQSAGEGLGLRTEMLATQAAFLTRIAEKTWMPEANFGDWTPERRRQLQTLIHPDFLGRSFRVLVQQTGNSEFQEHQSANGTRAG